MTLQNGLHKNCSGRHIVDPKDLPSHSMESWDTDGLNETLLAQIKGGHQLEDFPKFASERGKMAIFNRKICYNS